MRYWVAVYRPGRTTNTFEASSRKQAVAIAKRNLGHPQVAEVIINDDQKGTTDRFKKGEEPR